MKRLGFSEFYAHGGDWGWLITTNMAQLNPKWVPVTVVRHHRHSQWREYYQGLELLLLVWHGAKFILNGTIQRKCIYIKTYFHKTLQIDLKLFFPKCSCPSEQSEAFTLILHLLLSLVFLWSCLWCWVGDSLSYLASLTMMWNGSTPAWRSWLWSQWRRRDTCIFSLPSQILQVRELDTRGIRICVSSNASYPTCVSIFQDGH